jgi:hypothetical protein
MENIDTKIKAYYRNWRGWLIKYLMEHNDDIANYDEEFIEELFADGLTVKQAYQQLQSELKKEIEHKKDYDYDKEIQL